MRYRKQIIVIAVVVVAVVILWLAMMFSGADSITVPRKIATVSEGYEAIYPLKQRIAPDARLMAAFVDLDRSGNQFEVATVSFAFGATGVPGKDVKVITLDNRRHTAFVAAEFPKMPAAPAGFDQFLGPIDESPITTDVHDVLRTAYKNGLKEYSAIVPPDESQLEFRLISTPKGPMWHLQADGELGDRPTARLLIVVDARTGDVVRKKLEKAETKPD